MTYRLPRAQRSGRRHAAHSKNHEHGKTRVWSGCFKISRDRDYKYQSDTHTPGPVLSPPPHLAIFPLARVDALSARPAPLFDRPPGPCSRHAILLPSVSPAPRVLALHPPPPPHTITSRPRLPRTGFGARSAAPAQLCVWASASASLAARRLSLGCSIRTCLLNRIRRAD